MEKTNKTLIETLPVVARTKTMHYI
ncbi:hypothetical protein THIX_30656 [Thiomonas sp. X19]|nr:hypothetical protein THIX_30656 [Thiomonas sp. X19]